MSLDVDFKVKLSLLAGASVPVQQNYASEDKAQLRIWYQRQLANTDLFLDGGAAGSETTYAVEINGLDPDAAALLYERLIAPAVSGGLNGFRGDMGNSRVLGVFIEDASDDYEPRGLELDDGYHVFAFGARLLT